MRRQHSMVPAIVVGCAVAVLLSLAALPAPGARPAVVSGPAQDTSDADVEKQLRAAFRDGMKRKDAGERAGAVSAYGSGTRGLADGGSSRLVARTLGGALDDDELSVRAAALVELSWGRDPDTLLELLEEQLSELRTQVENAWTNPNEDTRKRGADAQRLFTVTCQILGRHADDRAVDLVASELKKLRRGPGPGNSVQVLIQPLADALLAMGSHESVETVIKMTDVYSGSTLSDGRGQVTAQRLHDALAAFAEDFGQAPPVFDDHYDQRWRDWWKRYEDDFPKTLGKLEAPIAQPEYVRPDRTPYRRGAGKPERP